MPSAKRAKIMINDARQAVEDASAEVTLGADKGYDAQEFIEACQQMKVTPHVAQNTSGRRSSVPDTIASSVGYAISQQKRKLIEQGFGWAKNVAMRPEIDLNSNKREIRAEIALCDKSCDERRVKAEMLHPPGVFQRPVRCCASTQESRFLPRRR